MSRKKPRVAPEKIHWVSINIFKANLETSEAFLERPGKSRDLNSALPIFDGVVLPVIDPFRVLMEGRITPPL